MNTLRLVPQLERLMSKQYKIRVFKRVYKNKYFRLKERFDHLKHSEGRLFMRAMARQHNEMTLENTIARLENEKEDLNLEV